MSVVLAGWECMAPITPATLDVAIRYLDRAKTLREWAEAVRWLWFRPIWETRP